MMRSALLLPLLASVLPQQKGGAPEKDVLRTYDLGSVLPSAAAEESIAPLLPYLMPLPSAGSVEWNPIAGQDVLVDLLRNLCGEELDYEGREVSMDDGGRLILKAPPSVQAKAERLLAFLDGVFDASTEIVIDALEPAQGGGDARGPALIPVADAEKLIAQAAPGDRRTWRLRIRPGSRARLDLSRVTRLVTDYNVEIAQASGIADPIAEDISVGTQILAAASPANGGMWLELILRRGDPLADVKEREIQLGSAVTTQDRVTYHEVASVVQSLDVLNRSMALSTFLPEGKALAIRTSIAAGGKARAETLIVRRGAGSLPMYSRASIDPKAAGKHREVIFLNAESAVPARCDIQAPSVHVYVVPDPWPMIRPVEMEPQVSAHLAAGSFDRLSDLLRRDDEDLEIRNLGPCFFLTREVGGDSGGRQLDSFSALAPPARLVQVSLVLSRAGSELARCALPLRDAEPAALVLGAEDIQVGDFDVEVAQAAAIADPVMRIGFDGLALWVRPSFSPGGDVTLEIDARAHVRGAPPRELDLRAPGLGKLDQATYDQLLTHERLVFGKGEGAQRRFVLGEEGAAGSKHALSLEVEASELK
jgi:hypothetical protein